MAMTMDKMMKSCMKSHLWLHTLTGVGLGMVLVSWLGLSNGVLWGVALVVVSVLAHFAVKLD